MPKWSSQVFRYYVRISPNIMASPRSCGEGGLTSEWVHKVHSTECCTRSYCFHLRGAGLQLYNCPHQPVLFSFSSSLISSTLLTTSRFIFSKSILPLAYQVHDFMRPAPLSPRCLSLQRRFGTMKSSTQPYITPS